MCKSNSAKGLAGLEWVTEKLNSGTEGLLDLDTFRENLKMFYQDCETMVKDIPSKIVHNTGEITKAVEELYEKEMNEFEKSFDDIVGKSRAVFFDYLIFIN
jgi:hypothetical protein